MLLTVTASARGEPGGLLGGRRQLPENNEMPGLHLLRQEQHCEKQRMFTAKACFTAKTMNLNLWMCLET